MRGSARPTATPPRCCPRSASRTALLSAEGDCCGALHIHAGLTDEARRLAERVMRSMPGDAPIVVNSAGCGAALKDYGHLLGTDEARASVLVCATSTSSSRR